ncbi:glycosyltransferase family 2 protein [Thalassotalea sp. LPB0316]|uniref:glycosyltransferase family 2 protein n=1 Tax=Thalassotalea sp. LPB0316 TaxID=2769490 RepID=UPI001866CD19|nr:glycosyltransferase family A protein [Thalassotalea sp. LPB0316]QOL24418.1 glycosyltransferase family 2 protein [Thalassotalea sp. LPB0316]
MLSKNELAKEIKRLEAKNKSLKSEISMIKISASYKLAQQIVERCKSKVGLLTLPFFIVNQFLVRKLKKFIKFNGHIPKHFSEEDLGIDITTQSYKQGVSVLIPCYNGEVFVNRCLDSLAKQSLPKALVEVIIILNGRLDNSLNIINSFQEEHPELLIRVESLEEANVSRARNQAIESATREFSIFLDIDDEISANYLKNLLDMAKLNTVVFANIKDVLIYSDEAKGDSGKLELSNQNHKLSFDDVMPLVSKNACKLIPTQLLKQLKYNKTLKSGEDVVFMSELFAKLKPQITLCKHFNETFYIRHVTDNSVSRKASSYEFCVSQRLEVIAQLDSLLSQQTNKLSKYLLLNFINFQLNFVADYILNNQESYKILLQDKRLNTINFDIETAINRKI